MVCVRITKVKKHSPCPQVYNLVKKHCTYIIVIIIIIVTYYMLYIRYNKNIGEKVPRSSYFESFGGEMLIEMMVRVRRETEGRQNLHKGQEKFFFLEDTFMLILEGGRVVRLYLVCLRNCMWSRTA